MSAADLTTIAQKLHEMADAESRKKLIPKEETRVARSGVEFLMSTAMSNQTFTGLNTFSATTTFATTSNYATNSGSASFSATGNYATNAGTATNV